MLEVMRVELTVADPRVGSFRNVLIDADDSMAMSDVLAELVGLSSGAQVETGSADVISLASRRDGHQLGPATPTVYHRGEALDPEVPFAEAGLKTGDLLSVGDAATSDLDEPAGLVEIRVVAGSRRRYGAPTLDRRGRHRHRRWLRDPPLRRTHPTVCAVLDVDLRGAVRVRATDGSAAVLAEAMPHADPVLALEREELGTEATVWSTGRQLTVGETLLELETVDQADAAVEDSAEPGWVDYNRPPRLLPPERPTKFKLPVLPKEQQKSGMPWIAMLMPVLMSGVTFAVVPGRRYMLIDGRRHADDDARRTPPGRGAR